VKTPFPTDDAPFDANANVDAASGSGDEANGLSGLDSSPETPPPSDDAPFALESPSVPQAQNDADDVLSLVPVATANVDAASGSDGAFALEPATVPQAQNDDDRLLPISGLQHLAFCPRQCALVHLDGVWSENFFTAAGRVMHERVHNADSETRGDVRTARGLWLRSKRLGLVGIADVVEFRRVDSPFADAPSETQTPRRSTVNDVPQSSNAPTLNADAPSETQTDATERPIVAVKLPKRRGFWRPYPVEYKRGQPKKNNCDAVQLCAQAICLEESLGCAILEGALFYGTTKRRVVVRFDAELRAETTELARRFRALVDSEVVPEPVASPRCKSCSLADECLPDVRKSASRYLRNHWREAGAFDAFADAETANADASAPLSDANADDFASTRADATSGDAAFDDEEDFA